ncbi:glycosyltransferase family 2 protein [Rhizobium sp. 2MFCol3.1]|uniref:glycosyltransferase family 2 protein n=1 Tax=Rhizobium sp. 2MFCol3.1 TaxID=1246459 RepID=UPI0003805047|nr:glycosyltransferase family 2 protein [Rhizobium sp. 2MFCol3.1]
MQFGIRKSSAVDLQRASLPASEVQVGASIQRKLRADIHPATGLATVTVVIPCYNYARYLREAVNSALSQEGVVVDVIIVDDRSTDNSLAVARNLAAADVRVVVIAHDINSGAVKTFNDGLAAARGEYLVRLDADDLLTPRSLLRSVAVMQRFPSVGLVYGHPIHFTGSQLPAHRDHPTSWTVWPGRDWLETRCRTGTNVITSPEVLMRRAVVDIVGGQMPLAHTHDMEMWLRMAAFCDVAYIKGADQAWHREHPKSLSAVEVDPLRDVMERRDAFETLFSGMAGQIPQADAFRDKARLAIAASAVKLAINRYDRGKLDASETEKLREIATAMVADVRAVPGWRSLERRMLLGARGTRRDLRCIIERVARGVSGRYAQWKWHRTGEW